VVAKPDQLRDRTVVLIDDVYTTGTTLNECARVLRKAGAREVVVATVARVYRSRVEMKIVSGIAHAAASQAQEEQVATKALAG
jgi:phosphoribosylpyrophosphate synthetase